MKFLNKTLLLLHAMTLLISGSTPIRVARGLARSQKMDRMTMHVIANSKARVAKTNANTRNQTFRPYGHPVIRQSVNRATTSTPGLNGDVNKYQPNGLIGGVMSGLNNLFVGSTAVSGNAYHSGIQVANKVVTLRSELEAKANSINSQNQLQAMKEEAALQIAQAALDKKIYDATTTADIPVAAPKSAVNFRKLISA